MREMQYVERDAVNSGSRNTVHSRKLWGEKAVLLLVASQIRDDSQ